jgi:hypothetical protein
MRKPVMQEMRRSALANAGQTFVLGGETYQYFYDDYNLTWCNERTVEIPIIWRAVCENEGRKVLEVGNVLSHYFPTDHLVVDKYERDSRVLNEDIVEFSSEEKFDLIVSISTLEHVGWDEKPKDPAKILKALQRLKAMLAEDGEIRLTLSWGWSPYLDRMILERSLGLTTTFFMRRISFDNLWEECDMAQLRKAVYRHSYPDNSQDFPPYPHANAIVIGTISKSH